MIKKLIAMAALSALASPAFAAKCVIAEYNTTVRIPEIPVAVEPRIAQQVVNFTSSTQSSVFGDRTRFVSIVCDSTAHFVVGLNPTATANDLWLPANLLYSIGVSPGLRIAFFDGS